MFIARFIDFLQFEKRFSRHTIVAYNKEVTQFVEYFKNAEIDIADISHRQVRAYLAQQVQAGKSTASVNRSLSALRTFYKYLIREGLADHNPLSLVRALKQPKKLPVIVENQKLNALLDTEDSFGDDFPSQRNKIVLELLYGTGIRLSELLTIDEGHIDFYNNTVRIFGKRSKERLVPINRSLRGCLNTYLTIKKTHFSNNNPVRLIVTNEGKDAYPKLIYRIVTDYLSNISSQKKKSPHVLRHTFATALLDGGADLNAIKELLGHAGLAATQVYTHNSVERLKSIYKQAHPKA